MIYQGQPKKGSRDDKMKDKLHLTRFIEAQTSTYRRALAEIRNGRKESHWMWYIFPQLKGLGSSPTAQCYAIENLAEAKAYLSDITLGPRLVEISEAVLSVHGKTAEQIFGWPDVLKLKSCATLFAQVSEAGSVFHRILDKYYDGELDDGTLALLANHKHN